MQGFTANFVIELTIDSILAFSLEIAAMILDGKDG